jgi:hypothetical protein
MSDKIEEPDEAMREEYDFSGGVRGRYAGRLPETCTVVALAPDVAEVFPDDEAVNQALRGLISPALRLRRRKPS